MTAGLQAAVVTQPRPTMKEVINEKKALAAKGELPPNPIADEMFKMNERLRKIEAKEKCLRVQFLDWLSDKLLDWSNRVHVMSSKIDSPCLIEVAPRKKEDSKWAKENREIDRLHKMLKEEKERNEELRKAQAKTVENLIEEFAELQKEMKK